MSGQHYVIEIDAHIVWRFRLSDHGSVGECHELGLEIAGTSVGQLKKFARDYTQEILLEHLECGTLGKFLQDRGWKSSPLPSLGLEDTATFKFTSVGTDWGRRDV